MISKLGGTFIIIASIGFIGATVWWITFFYDILGQDFQRARDCFYWTTDVCALKGMAAPFADVPVYDPFLLWMSVGMFVVGLFARVAAPSHH